MYYVYVLFSPSHNKTYVGFTSDLSSRLISHNELARKGYTIKYRPWILLHTEEFQIKKNALLRERELKSGKGREFIKSLIILKFKNKSCDSSGG
jgi:putative endonuclease